MNKVAAKGKYGDLGARLWFLLGALIVFFQVQGFTEEPGEVPVPEPAIESVEVISASGTVEVRAAGEKEGFASPGAYFLIRVHLASLLYQKKTHLFAAYFQNIAVPNTMMHLR